MTISPSHWRGGAALCAVALALSFVAGCAPACHAPPPAVARPPRLSPPDPAPSPAPPPAPEAAKAIRLHAKQATVHGTTARYEFRSDRDNIGFWLNINDWVSWDFTLEEAGTFLVEITLASPSSSDGSEYSVTIGDHTFTSVVESTGGWGKFVTRRLGIIELATTGPYTVAVKPITKPKGAVMNLQAITLRPGNWERGLVAWWQFDGEQGTGAVDTLLELQDTVAHARRVPGAWKTGMRFNGLSSAVIREAAKAPRLARALTIEAWVKLCAEPDGWSPIANQHQYPLGYFFGLDGAGDLGLHIASGGKWLACTSARRLPAKRWTHVAAAFDGEQGIAVYVDGEPAGRLDAAGPIAPADGVDLLLGKHNHLPWSFDGVLDEVRIFNRALPPDDVRRHCAEGRARLRPPDPIAIAAVRPDHTATRVHQRVTLDVDLRATWDNPFDAEDVSLYAVVAAPSLRVFRVPGFLYQPFARRLEEGKEVLEATGPPRWQIRLSCTEAGPHHIRVGATDRTGTTISDPVAIHASPADVPGRIRRAPAHPAYFATDRGEAFFPIGANVCWAGPQGTRDYDRWLALLDDNGANFFRVWLSPFWTTCAMNTLESGFDAIDLGNAWRFDHVLETAERRGLRVMPCIDSFNILRSTERSPGNFEEAPTIRAHGGPLLKPRDYFTHPRSLRAYRNRLRYLVARYAYSPSIFAWELWNEVNIVDDYDSATVAAWHAQMARTLRSLDPWHHLITTSHAGPAGDPAVDSLPEIDFVQSHSYGDKDMAQALGDHRLNKKAPHGRPHLHGEFGIAGKGEDTAKADPTGIHLHNALYACIGQGQAGTPMTWWWDSYLEPQKLFGLFAPFARWIAGFDFVAQNARPADVQVVVPDLILAEPAAFKPVGGTWDPADFNTPRTAAVDREGLMTHDGPISDVLHGLGFHKALHNPVTFQLDVPKATTFGVEVKGVSGHGDGRLQIHLDGKLALEKPFPVPEGNTAETLRQYNGVYSIDLPAGKHTVKVGNVGEDWVSVTTYKIPWLTATRRVDDPLRANGVVGESQALLWVQNRLNAWSLATAKNHTPRTVGGARLCVLGLAPGRWTIERWDPQKGEPLGTQEATVGEDSKLTFPLPQITWDAAFRLRRAPEPN